MYFLKSPESFIKQLQLLQEYFNTYLFELVWKFEKGGLSPLQNTECSPLMVEKQTGQPHI